jgi:DNA mismatch repair ATPase MutS
VRNDIAMGPVGNFLMLTGSNMSGKSTLLRTVGVNIVLAQAGGPVCAAALRMAPIALASSIRMRDSLELGMSYYMAELARLKEVVDVTDAIAQYGRDTMVPCFLLDEMLHGTNSSERRVAAASVIGYLLAHGATGIVTTHDLSLAQLPELAAVSRQAHFSERFIRGQDGLQMHFEYRLQPGLATSTNALKLMEMAGLPLPPAVSDGD